MWLSNSVIYEINTWVWLRDLSEASGRRLSLADVPEQIWDHLADLKISAVWMMGVWERSPAGVRLSLRNRTLQTELKQAFPDLRTEDLIGSPYCVRSFVVDPRLGGRAGLA